METMLVLNFKPELEEDMVDYLLALEGITGFTSFPVRGHGSHQEMSLVEQVSGRRKRLQIEIMIEESVIAKIISGLKDAVGNDIVYWEQMVKNIGRVV